VVVGVCVCVAIGLNRPVGALSAYRNAMFAGVVSHYVSLVSLHRTLDPYVCKNGVVGYMHQSCSPGLARLPMLKLVPG
jgi:hypothetical protein